MDNMLHRKLKIEQHESQQKCLNSRVSPLWLIRDINRSP